MAHNLTCWKTFIEPSTPNCMIYGEVGKLPLLYMIAFNLCRRDEYKSQWL